MEQFGAIGRDRVTGFRGRIIGRCQYMTGCDQWLLSPEVSDAGEFRVSQWFDLQRIEVLPDKTLRLPPAPETPGADLPAPAK